MAVSFYNFEKLHTEKSREELLEKFSAIMSKNQFIEGEENHLFEENFAKAQKAKHALLVANGTDALEISLKALDISPGDLVGVPSITFFATTEAVLNIGATPVFIDVNPRTGLLCPESLERMCQKFPLKAVMPVHIYGQCAYINEYERILKDRKIPLIEDGAQAHGTFYSAKRPVGSSENLTTFSFYPTKNLGAFGDAGAILTQSDEIAVKIKAIRNHGRGPLEILGRNSRCDTFQACVLNYKLENTHKLNQDRKEAAKKYYQKLNGLPIKLLPDQALETSSWHLFPILTNSHEERRELMKFLSSKEIGHVPFYEQTQHDLLPLQKFSGEWNSASFFSQTVLCLPMHPFLTQSEIDEVSDAVSLFYRS